MKDEVSRKKQPPADPRPLPRKYADPLLAPDPRRERDAYKCSACLTALFPTEEKIETGFGTISFREPLDMSLIEFKKAAPGTSEIEIRCKKCKSHLGSIVHGEKTFFRINSHALYFDKRERIDLLDLTEKALDAKDRFDTISDTYDQAKYLVSQSPSQATQSADGKTMTFLYGSLIGIIAGAAGAILFIKGVCIAPAVTIQTSSTPLSAIAITPSPRTAAATSTPLRATSTKTTNTSAPIPIPVIVNATSVSPTTDSRGTSAR